MENINLIPEDQLGVGSGIRLAVCDTEHDLYWRMAIEVAELIKKNNDAGEDTIMIVPYGPLGPYSRLVYLVNTYRISLKRCIFINMDEYLTDDKQYLDKSDPLSFRGGMDRIFYSQIDDELNLLPENRHFPIPGEEYRVAEIIAKAGKLDMAWGGVGINGHFAFNEPPEPGEVVTADEFLDRPTRVLAISRETQDDKRLHELRRRPRRNPEVLHNRRYARDFRRETGQNVYAARLERGRAAQGFARRRDSGGSLLAVQPPPRRGAVRRARRVDLTRARDPYYNK